MTEFDNFHLECIPLDPNQDYSYFYSCSWYSYTSYDPNTGYPYPVPVYDPNTPYYDANQYYPYYSYPGGYYGGYGYYGGGHAASGGGYSGDGEVYYVGGGSNWYSPGIGDLYQYFSDTDNDGFGDPNSRILANAKPQGFVSNAGDSCPYDPNKTDPGICGCGVADTDADQDGSYECEGDSYDIDPTINPGAAEICDGKDNDCDGTVPDNEADKSPLYMYIR